MDKEECLNLQDLQDLIISAECPDEDKAWSIPVQILIDQYETNKYNEALCTGNFSFVLQSQSTEPEAPPPKCKRRKTHRSRGTSTLHCCEKCGKEFDSKTLFVRHLKSHSDERPFDCEHCSTSFKYYWLRDKHVKMKHSKTAEGNKGGKLHTCLICHKTFPYETTLKSHLNTHEGSRKFKCSKESCAKSFSTSSQLNEHVRGHDQSFQCPICQKQFKSRSGMKSHQKNHQNDGIVKECDVCGRYFESVKSLQMHKRSHKDGSDTDTSCNKTKLKTLSKQSTNWFSCDVCCKVRSKDISTIMAHVLLEHKSEQSIFKTDGYHEISDTTCASTMFPLNG